MPTPRLTPDIISAAIDGFESQKRRIDDQIAELRAMLSGSPTETAASRAAPARKRRKFSADALRRMREAQQRRWAKVRGETAPPAAMPKAPKPKRKRKLSAAGRKAISDATKKRWAAFHAAKAEQPKKAAKKRAAKKPTVKKAAVKAAPAKAAKRAAVKKTPAAPSPAETAGQ